MFAHIGLKTKNIPASTQFYKAALAPLDFVPDESGKGFGPKGAPALWFFKGAPTKNAHFALEAKDRAAVRAFYKAGLKAGGRDNGPPGLRPNYGPKYYAAYLLDPNGSNIEAVYNK